MFGLWLLTLISAISLILCAAAMGMWVRSYWRVDVTSCASQDLHRVTSAAGGIFVESLAMSVRTGNWLLDAAIANGALAHKAEAPGRCDDPRQGLVRNSQRLQWVSGPRMNFTRSVQARAWPRIVKISSMQSARYDNSNGAVIENWLTGRGIWLPYWLIVVTTAILPVACSRVWVRHRRLLRLEQNRCVKCGYDLRASAGRCPECGTPVAAK